MHIYAYTYTYPCQIPRVDNNAWHRTEDSYILFVEGMRNFPLKILSSHGTSPLSSCVFYPIIICKYQTSLLISLRLARCRASASTSHLAFCQRWRGGNTTHTEGTQCEQVDADHPGPQYHPLPLPHTCVSLAPYPSSLSHPLSYGKWDCILLHSFSSLPSRDQYNHSPEVTKLAKDGPS